MSRPYKLQRISTRVETHVVDELEREAVRRSNRDGIQWTLSSLARRVLCDWAARPLTEEAQDDRL